jgi:hypothetical protein
MNLEILYGDNTYYVVDVGNEYQGCLQVLDEFVYDHDKEDIPISVFHITNLSDGYGTESIIGLSEVLMMRKLSAEYDEKSGVSPLTFPQSVV